MISLLKRSTLVPTDSGGSQKAGVMQLVGTGLPVIVAAVRRLPDGADVRRATTGPRFRTDGDGRSETRAIRALLRVNAAASPRAQDSK